MSRKPSIAEIGAFVAHLRSSAAIGLLLAEKADLLERIAQSDPGNREMADVAREARAAANRRIGR